MLAVLGASLAVFVSQAVCAGAHSYNSTQVGHPSAPGNPPSKACCFFVQDTVDVRYWAHSSTETLSNTITATIFITSVTEYLDTTVTNIESKVEPTIVTTISSYDFATRPGPDLDLAPNPTTTYATLNGTIVSTYGTTITSPTAFYVYSTVKVISVPAVIDGDGHTLCATTSTFFLSSCQDDPAHVTPVQVSGVNSVNSNAEAYYDLYDEAYDSTYSSGYGVHNESKPSQPGVILTLTTPFVYLSPHGAGSMNFSDLCNEDYGYVPQKLIDGVANNPDYVALYPGIASCLPCGPSIKAGDWACPYQTSLEGPITLAAGYPGSADQVYYQGGGLTISSETTITGTGCFRPGPCPPHAVAAPAARSIVDGPTPTAQPAKDTESPSTAATALPRSKGSHSVFGPGADPLGILSGYVTKQSQPNPMATPAASPIAQSGSASISFNPNSLASDEFSALHAALTASSAPASPSSVSNTQGPGGSTAASLVQAPGLGAVFANAKGMPPEAALSISVGTQKETPAASQASAGGFIMSASAAVINGVSTDLAAAQTVTANPSTLQVISVGSEAPITIGTQIFTPNPTAFRIAGTTVSAGGPGIRIDNTPISLQPSGGGLVVGSSIISLPTASKPALIMIGTQILTPNPTGYTVDGTTISAGGRGITIAGTYVSLASNGDLIVGGSTISATSSEPSSSASDGNLSTGTSNSAQSQPSNNTPIQTPTGTAGVSVPTSSSTKTATSKGVKLLRIGTHEIIAALVVGVVEFTLL